MTMKLGIRTESFSSPEDHRWLGSAHGTQECDSITLDGDTFLSTFTDGIIPSGVVVAKRVSDGLYIPYVGTAEKQQVKVDATAGTFTLTLEGQVSAAVAFNVSAADLKTALENLPNVNVGDVAVTGGPGNSGGSTPYFVEFVAGEYLDNPPALVGADVNLTGGGDTIAVTTPTSSPTDGSQTARGHLFTTHQLGPPLVALPTAAQVGNAPAALLWHGEVVEALLPSNHGLDSRAKTDLTHIHYV